MRSGARGTGAPRWRDWEQAWAEALYAPGGFVHTAGPAAAHFRTSAHVGPEPGEALAVLVDRVDHGLGRPHRLDVVDLGAGAGELLVDLLAALPPAVRARATPLAVDLRDPPPGFEPAWSAELPERLHGVVVAHEWLDAIPCPVVAHDGRVVRRVQVQPDGTERLGPAATGSDVAWLRRWWWPLAAGDRAEVGRPRDRAWADVLARLTGGVALAVDYGQPPAGPVPSLAGFRGGRAAAPTPDGRTDLTAHVHWPPLRSASGALRTQADALRRLGIGAGPPPAASPTDPRAWLRVAARAGRVAELTDPAGLGGYDWLCCPVGVPDPLGS